MNTLNHRLRPGHVWIGLLVLGLALGDRGLLAADEPHPGSEAFVSRMVDEYGLDADHVRNTLALAKYQQSIIDAISRPAEGKPWHEYRKIFLTRRRILDGVAYWQQHADLIGQVAARYGIAPEVILSILSLIHI